MATFSSVKINKILGKILNTATFSQNQITQNISNTLIKKKPKLIPKPQFTQIESVINTVYVDPLAGLIADQNKPFSPRLLNWVEPYFITGFRYTSFYTEVNSGLKFGDRVFIIGGNYDSDELIKINKYKKKRDGYKVLYVDRCQIVLDIEYTGVLPYLEDIPDNFVQAHYIEDEADFINVNRQITTKEGFFNYKFNYYQNNMIFTDTDFTNPLLSNGYGGNSGLTSSPGFFVRNSSINWTNISTDILSGTFSYAKSTATSSNDRMLVTNKSFTYLGRVYEKGLVYKFEVGPTQSVWVPDVKYTKPFITKGNFRDGDFDGKWNVGMYGQPNYKIQWKGTKSIWNTGTLMNTVWKNGIIQSLFTLPESYVSEFDQYNIAYQKSAGPNNNGKGYNFIVNSEIEQATLKNASLYDVVVGTPSNDFSIVKNHILGTSSNYKINVEKGYFENCTFYNSYLDNSELRKGLSVNTLMNNVKSINTSYKNSVIKNSNYISDSIIKILGYDEFLISENVYSGTTFSQTSAATHKVYKLYIDLNGYNRLKRKDDFYVKGLKINDGFKSLINFFDKKFKLTSWHEYSDFYFNSSIATLPQVGNPPNNISAESFYKQGQDISCFLSTKEDNKYIYSAVKVGTLLGFGAHYTKTFNLNPKSNYSIDIVVPLEDNNTNPILTQNFNYDSTVTFPDTLGTPSNIFNGNIIDISNAFIIDSNLDSGLVENTTWQSGNYINYNYDLNITKYSVGGGFYDLTVYTSSSTILATTSYTPNQQETENSWLGSTGSVVFLNSVDYDTSGRIYTYQINTIGSGYTSSIIFGTALPGLDSEFSITATNIDSVLTLSVTNPGTSYVVGAHTDVQTSTVGSGTGLTLDIGVGAGGVVSSISVNQIGQNYQFGDVVYINLPPGTQSTATIVTVDPGGSLISATCTFGGLFYEVGDFVTLLGGNLDATIEILSVTGSVTRLSDAYEVLNNTNGVLTLKEIYSGTFSVLSKLLHRGNFLSSGVENRYGYLHSSKIYKSKIQSGLFRRAYINQSLIENENLNVNDSDFLNYDNIKGLLISDSIFSNQNNLLSKATYINSFFNTGSDSWSNGIIYNSVWNGGTFSKGLVKDSSWDGGEFMSGKFYLSRSFNAQPSINNEFYYINNIRSYYKDGWTTATYSNNRNSWKSGKFNNGEFIKSDWEDGTFKKGRFYNSKWYNGTFSSGIIGDDAVPREQTKIYNGTILYAVVNNADVIADDTSFYGVTTQNIEWKNGIFNSGVFGTNIIQTTASNTAVWEVGVFNGGEFKSDGVWKNGTFNGGKFTSGYLWQASAGSIFAISNAQSQYAWQDGDFNGGEFGNGDYYTNSTWYTGEFNGGTWKGKVWRNGVFTKGEFKGGSTYSATGGYELISMTSSNALSFVDSFGQSNYFGVFVDGFVANVKDKFIKDKKIFTRPIRFIESLRRPPRTYFKNMLWLGGTFSHPNGEFLNSIWLDGEFNNGTFKMSSFNPFVNRNGAILPSFNTNDSIIDETGSCIWNNGVFDNSEFYISQWKTGQFIYGTAFGMVWKNGVSNYMNAFNIFWENGTWRNGNWYGSYFQYNGGVVENEFNREILFRGMTWSGTSSVHIWNVFTGNSTNDSVISTTWSMTTPIQPVALNDEE